MKLLLKLALLALLAKAFVSVPKGSFKELDRVGDVTLRQMATQVAKICDKAQHTISLAFADETTSAKGRHARSGAGHRPAD